MRVALMIEGQWGVSWAQWLALAETAEAAGLEALFRSDHYLSLDRPREHASLDAWTTLAGLAARTSRIRLGTLVSPVTFHHPSLLAKAVATVDHVSGGRAELGLGAGWMDLEHRAYGFEFPPLRERLERLVEQLEVVHRVWTEDAPSFAGRYYALDECPGLPKPVQRPRPPIIVGGRGRPGTTRPAARFADEYNTFFVGPEEAAPRRKALDEACEQAGRDPASLPLSVMTGFLVGADRADLRRRARRRLELDGGGGDPDGVLRDVAARGLAGTPAEIVERLREYEEAGVERVMLQQHHDDLEAIELLGREVLPALP